VSGRLLLCMAVAVVLTLAAAAAADGAPQDTLARRPFAPTDRGLFVPDVYPGTQPLAPAAGSPLSDAEALDALGSYLTVEFPGDTAAQDAAKAVFNDATAKAKIPAPTLRAGFAALRGTVADGAVDFILHAQTSDGAPLVKDVVFGTTEPQNVAQVGPGDSAHPEQIRITFKSSHQADNPFLFSRLFVHEALHQDPSGGTLEEAAAVSLDSLFLLGQLARHPELAATGSEVARRNNSNALLRLNSGTGSALGLYATNGNAPIFPGGAVDYRSFWARFSSASDLNQTPPGNQLLGSYLTSFHAPGAPDCSAATFDKSLLDCIDANGNGGLAPGDLVAAAQALKLDTGCKVPRLAGLKLAAAKRKIVSAGCKTGRVKRKKAAKRKRGRVLSQKPQPGKLLSRGAKVALVVGR
jgi:hypothetical protein